MPRSGRKPTTTLATRNGRRSDIQGLRALAVIGVIANHLTGAPSGGFLGVDVFFVISGFLITGLLVRERQQTGRISLADFYRRRVKRIVPLALLVTMSTCLAAFALFNSARADSVLTDAKWSAAFLANWHFAASGTDYFTSQNATSPLQHLWSLSVEEQFYVVWPLLLIAGFFAFSTARFSRQRGALVTVAIALVGASFFYAVASTSAEPIAAYFSTPARAWELGFGAVLALALPLWERIPRAVSALASWFGLGGILASFVFIDASFAVPGPWALAAVASSGLVILGGAARTAPRLVPLSNPVTAFIGDISYSLYLWHLPVIVFVGVSLEAGSPALYAAAIALTGGLSVATYYLLERPALSAPLLTGESVQNRAALWREWRKAHGATYRTGGLAVLSGITVVLCAATLLPSTSPAVTRPLPVAGAARESSTATDQGGPVQQKLAKQIEAALGASTWPDLDPSIDAEINGPDAASEVATCGQPGRIDIGSCSWGSPSAKKSLAVVGDSVALAYAKTFIAMTEAHDDISVTSLGQFGCPLADLPLHESSTDKTECSRHREETLTTLETLQPDVVVVTDTYAPLTDATTKASVSAAQWKTGMKGVTDRMAATGAQVVFLPPPPPGAVLETCFTPRSVPSSCISRVSSTWTARAETEKSLAKSVQGTFVDTRPLFCVSGLCPAFVGRDVVKSDLNHLTVRYATAIAPAMYELLKEAGVLSPA